jgi:hypothetical protein
MLLPAGGFRHFFHETLPAAQAQINVLNNDGHTVYIAQATFSPGRIAEAQAHNKSLPYGAPKTDRKKERSQANAVWLKNFFLDIDCGEKWPLKNQREGADALKQFVADTGLPFPAVVNSGNGLYAQWILAEAIPAEQWQTVARLLKKVVSAYSPAVGGDASRTSDSASVLRPPGTTNRKPGREPKPVVLIKDADPIAFLDFARILSEAAKRKQIDRTAVLPPAQNADVNAEFFSGLEQKHTPSDAEKIAEHCAQIRMMRDTKGDVIEPIWYSCIGVLAFCEDGDEVIHRWSEGHHAYNPAEAAAKIKQWRDTGVGPTTCYHFGSQNAAGCLGCRSNGKIRSPIVLGRPEPEKIETPDEQCDAPDRFRRSSDGLFAEEDGRWVRFYDQDLYLDRLAYDESLGYEVMTIKHSLPHEGLLECTLRSSTVNDPKALLTLMSDNHIKVVGVKEKKYMAMYLESYAAKLQRQRRMALLLCQMGWKQARNGQPMFVLGRKIFHADGTMEDASMARNVPRSAEGYHSAGDLTAWSNATKVLGQFGMEPHAFALLAGGFGAPLMKFTGFDGALVALVGETGSGKTLMLRWIESVWGYHNDLMMLRDDTKNALVSRLGVYGNLPLTIDEISNIEGQELSDLVYKITQGRDKGRLSRSGSERAILNTWNTVAVASSNHSLTDKLAALKSNASAEMNRVLEINVSPVDGFGREQATEVYRTFRSNYGVAGPEFIEYITRHQDQHRDKIDAIVRSLDLSTNAKPEERFWSAVAGSAIYGGLIAAKLGLIDFQVAPLLAWVKKHIIGARVVKEDNVVNYTDLLGQFLDAMSTGGMVTQGNGPKEIVDVVRHPKAPLVYRINEDTLRLFISRSALKTYLEKTYGSYSKLRQELEKCGALVDTNKRKVLGGGTIYGGAQQPVWEVDLTCVQLGRKNMAIVKKIEAGREAVMM